MSRYSLVGRARRQGARRHPAGRSATPPQMARREPACPLASCARPPSRTRAPPSPQPPRMACATPAWGRPLPPALARPAVRAPRRRTSRPEWPALPPHKAVPPMPCATAACRHSAPAQPATAAHSGDRHSRPRPPMACPVALNFHKCLPCLASPRIASRFFCLSLSRVTLNFFSLWQKVICF